MRKVLRDRRRNNITKACTGTCMQWIDASDEWSKLEISSARVGLNSQKLSTVYENIKIFKTQEFSKGLKKVEQRGTVL